MTGNRRVVRRLWNGAYVVVLLVGLVGAFFVVGEELSEGGFFTRMVVMILIIGVAVGWVALCLQAADEPRTNDSAVKLLLAEIPIAWLVGLWLLSDDGGTRPHSVEWARAGAWTIVGSAVGVGLGFRLRSIGKPLWLVRWDAAAHDKKINDLTMEIDRLRSEKRR